jgi:hypothetical protein
MFRTLPGTIQSHVAILHNGDLATAGIGNTMKSKNHENSFHKDV